MPFLRSPARPVFGFLATALLLTSAACGDDVDNDPAAAGPGPGTGGAGATGGDGSGATSTGGSGATSSGGSGGADLCGAPERAHARADVSTTGAPNGACQVPSVEALETGVRVVVVCDGGNATIDITADPPIALTLVNGDFVDFTLTSENLEGPEFWGALHSPDDGSLLLGFATAGSSDFGRPWYAPVTLEEGGCGDGSNRQWLKLGYAGDTTLVSEAQRRTFGAGDEYVVQTSALHGLPPRGATVPSDSHIFVIARQP